MKVERQASMALGVAIGLLTTGLWQSAHAYEAGQWLVRAGAKLVDPKSDNNDVVSVDDDTMFTFDITYMATDSIGIELLAAAPFTHDLRLANDGTRVGSTDHLPPTLSVQYHANTDGRFQPYIGLGVNWTIFFNEKTTGPIAESDLSLDDSFGLAGQIGADILIGEKWLINADMRYLDIDTDASLDGADLGSVEIDPWVFGISAGYRFGRR